MRVREFGAPEVLRLEVADEPKPEPGEVIVSVELAGVSYGDVIVRSGRHPFEVPYVPGIEVGGEVVAVGPDANPSLLGRRVVATTVGNTGGYAELARTTNVFEVPPGLALDHAVAVFQAGQAAAGMLEVMGVAAADAVLITAAAGRIGSLLVQLAKATGATVIGAACGPGKCAVVSELGADVAIDYRAPDWVTQVKAATGGRGADVVLEAVGGTLGRQALDATADRFGSYGFSSGAWTAVDDAPPGVTVSSPLRTVFGWPDAKQRAGTEQALQMAAEGRLVPRIAKILPLASAAEAHAELEGRQTVGAVLLAVSPAAAP
jgi:NADPH2:quinone reductase